MGKRNDVESYAMKRGNGDSEGREGDFGRERRGQRAGRRTWKAEERAKVRQG